MSRLWLGSDFCAQHILRHADAMQEMPCFWTREQRGEEASAWLLFAHKYAYLADTAAAFRATDGAPIRVFCVPSVAVDGSAQPERILLLLAVALMESFGIRVEVCVVERSWPTGLASTESGSSKSPNSTCDANPNLTSTTSLYFTSHHPKRIPAR